MSDAKRERSSPPPPVELTPRESAMLHQAGDRVFTLARRLAGLEREITHLQGELQHKIDLLTETRSTRDVLSNQVETLQLERERDYEERAELRKLLVAMTGELQIALSAGTKRAAVAGPSIEEAGGEPAPRPAALRPQELTLGRWLRNARREFSRIAPR